MKCHGLFHIVFVFNGHMPLGGEQLVFKLAHTSWWVYGIQFNILYGLNVIELEYISY